MTEAAAVSASGERAVRYDSPWQRLPWTGPLALVAWALALWAMSLAMTRAPATLERPPPIEARFIELPKPPKPPEPVAAPLVEPPPVVRRPAQPVQRPRKQAAAEPTPAAAPPAASSAPDLPQAQTSAQSSEQPSGLSAQAAATGSPGASSSGRPRIAGHPGASVRANAVGVIDPPQILSIHNEENVFDHDGTGNGASPGGWAQESSAEECVSIMGEEGPCDKALFSQPSRPWCYDADPYFNWDVGTCKIYFDKAIAAFQRKNYPDALAELTRLAEKNYTPAQASLGAMYAEGTGIPKDEQQAVHWYQKAAADGDGKAIYNLALMYNDGRGVPRDDKQAAYWYRKAAYYGFAVAQYNLAVMYASGIGVPRDDKQAVYWYRKAATRGVSAAQYNLGVMYAEGLGIAKDERQAVYWYCKGTVRGETNARTSLARLYASGTETPSHDELAFFCWEFTSDKRAAQIAYQDREKFEKGLTPEQRATAQAAARLWKSR